MALSVIEQSETNPGAVSGYVGNAVMVLLIAQAKADGLLDDDQTDYDSSQACSAMRGHETGNHGEAQDQCDGKIGSHRRQVPYVLGRPWRRRDREQRHADIEGYRRFDHEETDEPEKDHDSQKQLAAPN